MKKLDAKKDMLKKLSGEMRSMMGDERKGMYPRKEMEMECEECEGEGCEECEGEETEMKVVVAGDSTEAIEAGLDKAKKIMKARLGE